MKADNQTNNVHENEPRSEYGNLPPELKATQKMMDAMFGGYPVFGALNAAPPAHIAGAGLPISGNVPIAERMTETCSDPAPGVAAPHRLDIEKAIMRAPGFDYNLAWEIFAALQARLESRYENNLNEKVADAMKALDRALAQA